MQGIRIYEMPACKMVSSGKGMFGEGNFPLFEEWFSSQKRSLFPKDFLKNAAFFRKIFCIGQETDLSGCICMKRE